MQGAVLEESKTELRRRLLNRRRSVSSFSCHALSRLIQAKAVAFPPYLAVAEVALYSPIENEVGTSALLAHALENKKKVFYPRLDDEKNSAWFFQILSEAELRGGRFGILEPAQLNSLSLPRQEGLVVFVPGVAFDPSGHRLGRGGGSYDRMLVKLKGQGVFVGLGFEFQVLDALPTDAWDQKVHYIITEKRIIDCGASAPQSIM
jgi:5-formyltetrahydrofolate cyclo-ligase